MKAIFGILTIAALVLTSCNTAYQASSGYNDDVYYSASNSTPIVKVNEDNSNYQPVKYQQTQRTFSSKYKSIYTDTETSNTYREEVVARNAAQKYSQKDTIYIEPDTVVYVEQEIVEEEPYYESDYGFDYSTRIYAFHRPYWRYNYYGFYDPFYYSYYWNNPFYYDYHWDIGWNYYSGFHMSWRWPYYHSYYNPYYHNYYWGYPHYNHYYYGNSAINHHKRYRDRYYGPRKNFGRNHYAYSRSSSTGLRNNLGINSRATGRNMATTERKTINRGDIRNRNAETKSIIRKEYASQRDKLNRNTAYKKDNRDYKNGKSIVKYRKPKTYTNPSNRNFRDNGNSKVRKQGNYKTNTPQRTVKRVVTNPNRTKNYTTPNRVNTKNYSTPVRTKSQQYRSPSRSSRGSKTYSTPVKSNRSSGSRSYSTPTRSNRSSGTSSRSYSSPSRSSGSSGTRSSSGSGRGVRKR